MFVKGQEKTPGSGRKAGTRNNTSKALREQILQALDEQEGGAVGYLKRLAVTDQKAFAGLLGRVLPTQLTGDDQGGAVRIEITRRLVRPADG